MPKIYVQSENDEQPVEFTGDITELIPDELFFKDGRYRTVVDESVKRRQTIKELSSKLQEATAPEPQPQQVPAPQTTIVEVPKVEINEDELYEKFKRRQIQERAAEIEARASLVALLAPNGLDESFLPILENAKDPATVAQELGRKKLQFAQSGVNTKTPDAGEMFGNINKRLGLK